MTTNNKSQKDLSWMDDLQGEALPDSRPVESNHNGGHGYCLECYRNLAPEVKKILEKEGRIPVEKDRNCNVCGLPHPFIQGTGGDSNVNGQDVRRYNSTEQQPPVESTKVSDSKGLDSSYWRRREKLEIESTKPDELDKILAELGTIQYSRNVKGDTLYGSQITNKGLVKVMLQSYIDSRIVSELYKAAGYDNVVEYIGKRIAELEANLTKQDGLGEKR